MGFFDKYKKIDFSRNEVAQYILKVINESDMAIAANIGGICTDIEFMPVEYAYNYKMSGVIRRDKVIHYSDFGYPYLDKPEALRDWIYSNMKLKDKYIVINKRIPGEDWKMFEYFIIPNNKYRYLKQW